MGITPTFDQLCSLAAEQRCGLAPIAIELLADTLTPVSAFRLLTAGDDQPAFLLESVEGGERVGRYSFIGVQPREVVALHADEGDPLAAIRRLAETEGPYHSRPGLPRFTGGAVGWLGYEAATAFERLPRARGRPYGGLPDGVFGRFDTIAAFDHVRHTLTLITHVRLDAANLGDAYRRAVARLEELQRRLSAPVATLIRPRPAESSALPVFETSNFTRAAYEAAVERAREYIRAGDIFQVVPSQRFARPTPVDAFTIYRALRAINPSPYMYLLRGFGLDLIGASPEMLLRVEHGLIETHPIAGTRRRGRDEADDQRLAEELLNDPKERAEHLMLVDLGRNDVGRVAEPGSVRVPQFMQLERYSHVMHLVSRVTGRLRADLTPLDALRSCFPAGTVSGAPKIRAMEIIAELEPDQRGPYSGCVGYLSFDGTLDTAITIRTIYLRDGVAFVQAGGGVVADSVPALEWQETQNKARALLRAIELAEAMAAE
ncbi:anthranilate synthase component I [Kallotenue papyrolyticum]|uniref:anthranilate synthase component I n=1 Tax=Kallotenue papyrolyticum TaxID=1325125 RepID=UPI0004786733|nr:anthranilate synthase component I [Kallotenue papyrolyticum]